MQCPVDTTTLLMSERQGVEIDYCPQCRGIWLDRGELDKLLKRADDLDADDDRDRERDRDRSRGGGDRDRYDGPRDQHHPKKKKKKGWLSEVFEFD